MAHVRPTPAETAFTSRADTYDVQFEDNPLVRRLRRKIYDVLRSVVESGGRILDINCGTGTDVLALIAEGYVATGVDLASGMIKVAKTKAAAAGLSGEQFLCGSFDRLPPLPFESYDAVLSNFGGLNCTDTLSAVESSIAPLLRRGGHCVGVVMPPIAPWDMFASLFRGKPHIATRRWNHVSTGRGFGQAEFPVWYYSLRDISMAFRHSFDLVASKGLCVISPPPNSRTFAERHARLTMALQHVDNLIEDTPPFSRMGDHILFVLRKR